MSDEEVTSTPVKPPRKKRVSKKVKNAVKDLLGKVFSPEDEQGVDVSVIEEDISAEKMLFDSAELALTTLKDMTLMIEYGRSDVALMDAKVVIEKLEKMREDFYAKYPDRRTLPEFANVDDMKLTVINSNTEEPTNTTP